MTDGNSTLRENVIEDAEAPDPHNVNYCYPWLVRPMTLQAMVKTWNIPQEVLYAAYKRTGTNQYLLEERLSNQQYMDLKQHDAKIPILLAQYVPVFVDGPDRFTDDIVLPITVAGWWLSIGDVPAQHRDRYRFIRLELAVHELPEYGAFRELYRLVGYKAFLRDQHKAWGSEP